MSEIDDIDAENQRLQNLNEIINKSECPGIGKCHGSLGWCDNCGDVNKMCNDQYCDTHFPNNEFGERPEMADRYANEKHPAGATMIDNENQFRDNLLKELISRGFEKSDFVPHENMSHGYDGPDKLITRIKYNGKYICIITTSGFMQCACLDCFADKLWIYRDTLSTNLQNDAEVPHWYCESDVDEYV